MDQMKIGIVGCGNIATKAYLPQSRQYPILDIVACADLDVERAKQVGSDFGIRGCSVQELMADDEIELVVNLTIPAAHAEVALKAIDAGKHIYGEKPLAVTADEGRQILDAAAKKGVRVGNAPDTFLGTSHQTCRALVDEGAIGRPVSAVAFMMCGGHETWHPSPEFYYQKGGGPMFDMGPYYLTALMNLLGPIRRVAGLAGIQIPDRTITSQPLHGKKIHVETPDHVAGTIEFESGAIATIVTSFAVRCAAAGTGSPIQLFGTEGALAVPDPNNFNGPIGLKKAGDKESTQVEARHTHPNGRSIGLADMAHAIRQDRAHRASGDLSFAVLDAMQGFLESSETGRYHDVRGGFERPAVLPTDLNDGVLD